MQALAFLIILFGSAIFGICFWAALTIHQALVELRTIRQYLNNFHLDVWHQIHKDRI